MFRAQTENKKERKASSHFRFRFGRCAGEFIAQEFPELFLGLQKFAKYYICLSRLENGRMQYKQKENVECLPLALSSKRHVIVSQNTAKKCIKARPIYAARLSHLGCKNTYPGIIELLHIPELNCYISWN